MPASLPIEIALLWAASPRGLIGRDDWMPWRLPDDLRRFKALTLNGCIVMGHRTYRCLGRPLPQRSNLVMTRHPETQIDGVQVVASLEAAMKVAQNEGHARLWVVGGAQIYRLALPLAQHLELTLVDDPQEPQPTDTCFEFQPDRHWRLQDAVFHPKDDKHSHAFSFLSYKRIP